MAQIVNTYIVLRNDTTANWQAHSDQILLKGEVGIEFLPTGEKKIKIGDGVTRWADLEYSQGSYEPVNGALLESITQEKVDQWNAAQPNMIEKIFVNGAELLIVDKKVDIAVPTKASDIGAAESDHDHDGVYLKANEMIPAALLPGFVDDVVEAENFEALPNPGESGKLYITTNDNRSYRWSGTQYVEMHAGVSLGETAETAFRGDLGKIAYEHAMSDHAPANAQENVIEIFKMAGEVIPVKEKSVEIPVASATTYGVVKSSSGANQVNVAADGTMKVSVISTSSLRVPIGESLILNGGAADGSDPVYPTRIGNIGYDSVAEAVASANAGDVVTLMGDVDLGPGDNDNLVVTAPDVTLDLSEGTLTAGGSNGAIRVKGGMTTIAGDGSVTATLGSDNYSMAVWASNSKVIINGGTYQNATDGSARGTDLIYASGNALIEITGGTFIAAKPEWTLNCKDADYKSGISNIIVKGGRFYKFDPANNSTEGPGTNYVAEGYQSIKDGDYYVVTPVKG